MMDRNLAAAIENAIADSTGDSTPIVEQHSTSGGCINQTEVIRLADGRRFFLKTNGVSSAVAEDLFEREAESLIALAGPGVIAVPAVIGWGVSGTTQFLVLEVVEQGSRCADFFQAFGRQLAELHRHSGEQRFGFDSDNYLGSTRQPNQWSECWVEFWTQQRLGFQFQLARENGYADQEFNRLGERLVARLDALLRTDPAPSLLHGDLWSGNFMQGSEGEPVLIDPAVYFGHREAEFGMTTLFGGFAPEFYAAYNEVWPLESGSEDRIEIYRLYHVLNHLNLFGASYRRQCLEIMKKFA